MRSSFIIQLLAIVLAALIDHVVAGAEANVTLCIWSDMKPLESVQIEWNICAPNSRCVECRGDQTRKMTIDKEGLNCLNIGYQKRKSYITSWDNCHASSTLWYMSYNGPGYSGQIVTKWTGTGWNSNWAYVDSPGDQVYSTWDTAVCSTKALCTDKIIRWSSGESNRIDLFYVVKHGVVPPRIQSRMANPAAGQQDTEFETHGMEGRGLRGSSRVYRAIG